MVYDPMIVGYTEILASLLAPDSIQAGGLGGGIRNPTRTAYLSRGEAYVPVLGNSQQREIDAI